MQYKFQKLKGNLIAVITDTEGTDLSNSDLSVENLKTYGKCSIDDGLTSQVKERNGVHYALISKDKEGLLGNFDINDLRLYATKKPKEIELETEGFE